jgi:hypothetical protein
MNNWFKQNGTHLAIAALFFVISFFYFAPAFQGKVLSQGDVLHATAMSKEVSDYRAKDTTILWTNQLFGGMPTYQIWVPYANNVTTYVIKALKATFPVPIDTVLLFLFGTYLLFCVLKLNPWLAAAGAIAFTFSSYNIILLGAGHANQAFAIAFFAPILAGIILTLRGRYLLGGSLTALFLAMEVRANHIQMTYYLLFAIAILVGIELYHAIKAKTTQNFYKAAGYLAVAAVLALAVNASMLWSTYEYGQESNRGKSNLTSRATKPEPKNGLGRDYAYMWSQGVGECLTFLVPDLYGSGGDKALDENSKSVAVLAQLRVDPAQAIGASSQYLYWGEKPFTGGPFYFGAAICFLFIAGLLIVRDRIKWWLLGTVILVMLLSFGKNWPFVSDLFFNYFPLYNKFRTVESILTIATLCFPLLAFVAVREIIATANKAEVLKKVYLAFYITGGLCLLLALAPDVLLSFKTDAHQSFVDGLAQQFGGNTTLANSYASALVQDRISLAKSDAWRSLFLVALTFGIVWAFIKQKINVTVLSVALLVITLGDLWTVDKRYLKEDSFVASEDMQQPKPREVDNIILRDPDPDYRVFDLTSQNPFTDSYASFFYKSFGGYHAAKLKRFDELQERQFNGSINHDVLDMMNVKYIIAQDPKTQNVSMQANRTACGHAWFVQHITYVKNADEEMQAISSFAPKEKAIIDEQYKSLISEKDSFLDTSATIKLVHYNPDHMVYQSSSTSSQIAVFSEVYYDKGWTMLIDGKETPYFRANYLLRAAQIPVGNHEIRFDFHPASYYTGEKISLAGSVLLILALGFAGYAENKKKPTGKKA